MTVKNRKAKAWGCAILAITLSVAAITLTPIGPIGIYGWLVPIISPVIPKPEGVPSRAKAEYHWKGFGMIWYWEDRITGGCAQRWAADGPSGPVRGLSIFEGGEKCDEGKRALYRFSFLDHTTFGSVENRWPYEECPFNLSASSVDRLQLQIEELIGSSSGEIETQMLAQTRQEIGQIERLGLHAEQHGCRVDRK